MIRTFNEEDLQSNIYTLPVKFEVPASEPWPSSLHGLRLGKRLEHILSSQEFFDVITDIDILYMHTQTHTYTY